MYDLIVIGGGPAGLAAALEGYARGLTSVLVIERDAELRFIKLLNNTTVEAMTDTTVLELTPDKAVHAVSPKKGYMVLRAKAVVLAMGSRERSRGEVDIPGRRPAGVFTAGMARRYVNIEGKMPGSRVVMLGSGDSALIMVRHMMLEGIKVEACIETMPYSMGSKRNIVQCLDDFDIPLHLSQTLVDIRGKNRVEGVTVAKVDKRKRSLPGTEFDIECDTVILSVGRIPENELTRRAGIDIDPRTGGVYVYENMETSVPGIFACGNVVHIHDITDVASEESKAAGKAAAAFAFGGENPSAKEVAINSGRCIAYTVPQKIRPENIDETTYVFFRVNRNFGKSVVKIVYDRKVLAEYKKPYMEPGGMERVAVSKNILDELQGKELIILAEEAME